MPADKWAAKFAGRKWCPQWTFVLGSRLDVSRLCEQDNGAEGAIVDGLGVQASFVMAR